MENLINLTFPPTCLFCHKSIGSVFCKNCLESLPTLENNKYLIEVPQSGKLLEVFSPFDYDDSVRTCIKYAKYGSRQFQALKILAYAAAGFAVELKQDYKNFIVVPIPLNPRKFRSRGFNQAEIISKIISKTYAIPHDPELLTRIKSTTSQYLNNRKSRYENIRGAFTASEEKCNNKKVLLVDDICTSGATLSEACGTIYKQGKASDVKAFTLSRRL